LCDNPFEKAPADPPERYDERNDRHRQQFELGSGRFGGAQPQWRDDGVVMRVGDGGGNGTVTCPALASEGLGAAALDR
jgi:hypothetical protein